jgi:uracil-DNA glycosylase family 4
MNNNTNETDLFGNNVADTPAATTKRASAKTTKANGKPSTEEQKRNCGIGTVDPEIYQKLIVEAKLCQHPREPKKIDGILTPGAIDDWYPRRGTGKNKILVVSVYPSDEEQKQKRVLVGPGGQAINEALKGVGIHLDDCWITNVLRYYLPAKSTVPASMEEQCIPYLKAEIEFLKPELILCLGAKAFKAVVGKELSLEDYRGERFKPKGKTYEVAGIWQPAHVLRTPEIRNVWLDDIAAVFGKKKLPPMATDYREQDKLPLVVVKNKTQLLKEVREMLALEERCFAIDTEYYGENPNTSPLLRLQIASASRTLLLKLRDGHSEPQIHLKNNKKSRLGETSVDQVINLWIKEGLEAAVKGTQSSEAAIYQLLQHGINKEKLNRALANFQAELLEKEGQLAVEEHNERFTEETYTCQKDGNIMVFESQDEIQRYLQQTGPLAKNLIAYVINSTYVFDCDEKEIGKILHPLFFPKNDRSYLYGQNGNVDWTRCKASFKLDLSPLQVVDTMLLALLHDEGQPRGLEDLIRRYLGGPNHKRIVDNHMKARGLEGKPYSLIYSDVLDIYSLIDGRRSYDLVAPMLYALGEENAKVTEKLNDCRVPITRPGEKKQNAKEWRTDLQVNNWEHNKQYGWGNGNDLFGAFNNYKMPQYQALAEPMQVGQPFNPDKMKILIDWYENKLAIMHKKCQEVVAEAWIDPFKPDIKNKTFNPSSQDQSSYFFFHIRNHKPTKSTENKAAGKKAVIWNLEIHAQWLADLKAGKKSIKIKPSCDSKDLEMLAEIDPIAKLVGDTRFLSTIVKNYMKKGGRWLDKIETVQISVKEIETQAEKDIETMSELQFDEETNAELDEIEANQEEIHEAAQQEAEDDNKEAWKEHQKAQRSKAISLLLSDDNSIYSTYYPTLETHRLATKPNVSAIIRGEAREVYKIFQENPPYEIRQLNEAPEDYFLSSNDWKGAEIWMIATLAWNRSIKRGKEQRNLLDIVGNPKRCVHASTARQMFPNLLKDLSDLEIKDQYAYLRELAKPVVFGIPYGRGAKAIAQQLNQNSITQWMEKLLEDPLAPRPEQITTEQAEHFIDAYFEVAPECWDFLEEQKSLVYKPGFQVNPWGFVRRYPSIKSEKEGGDFERQAANWQIQCGVACAMMQSMDNWQNRYKKKFPKMPMYLIDILHDATKFLFHKDLLPYHDDIIQDIQGPGLVMPFPTPVPLGVDPTVYKSYELKEFASKIELEDTKNPKAHKKTFLGKHGDTPANRNFYGIHGKKSDYAKFVEKYAGNTSYMNQQKPLSELLKQY